MRILTICFFLFLTSCRTSFVNQDKAETAQLHMQIGISHIQKENYPLALRELLIAQDYNPNDPAIQANLGHVYFQRDRFDLAEQHYKRAISLAPTFTDAKNNLARVYIETSQNKLAEKYLQEVLSDLTYIDFPRAYANYGVLEFNRKNYPKAISYLKKSLEKDRENCLTHVYLGRSYLELKENAIAVAEFEKSTQFCQDIDVDDAHYYGAIALYRNKQRDRSIVRFEELIRLFPNSKNIERAQKMLDVIKKDTL